MENGILSKDLGILLAGGERLAVQYSRSETFGEALIWLVWDFTGLRFIATKVFPTGKGNPNPPVTITLWVVGIYTALFGIASNRYENSVDKIENRMNAFITQLAVVTNPLIRKEAFGEVAEIQKMRCPVEPELLKLSTVFLSLVADDAYGEAVTVLRRTVSKHRDNLEGAILLEVDLERAILEDAKLKGAHLRRANLKYAKLLDANLENANLIEANLKGAFLNGANLEGADLKGADIGGANLEGAILENTTLVKVRDVTSDQLCSTRTLYQAAMDRKLEAEIKQQCPAKLDKPKQE